jgi:outer membrane protein
MIPIWRTRRASSLSLISWKGSVRIGVVLLATGCFCPHDVCQSQPEMAGHDVGSSNSLQLSLHQAIRMALENNLDIRFEQIDQSVADFSAKRTQGGAIPRSINYTITETPAGAAVAPLPLLDSTASTLSPAGIQPSGITIPSSYDAGHVLEAQHSLSIATAPFSLGAPVPAFDLDLMGQYGWIRRDPSNALVTSSSTTGDTSVTNNTLANTFAVKGFSSGASIQLGINNFVDSYYSGRSSAVPFTHPNAYAVFAQPLLRGAGRTNNTRYIEIAKTNKKISADILEQQLISTISGVETLYWDLVSLQNSVKVQQKALDAANRLLNDNRQQSQVGRMPPVDVARAEALVAASQLALAQSISLRNQQENVLRSVIDPQSLATPNATLADIVAIDELSSASDMQLAPVAELVQHALEQRPDLRQSKLQVSNGERAVAGSANARLPELDVYGSFQSRGVISPGLVPVGGDPTTGAATVDSIPTGGVRASQILQAGIQFNVPVQNKVAEADLRADRAQLQQERLRLLQMQAQAAAEVRNAVIAVNTAKQAVQASASARNLQEQLLSAEAEKFRAGFSTTFAVIEQQSYLTQAETTEIAAQLAWKRAAVQLYRALGDTLRQHGIDVDSDARKSKLP